MGAVANLVENGQQSWSARHLEVTLHMPPRVSGLGPSIFAAATVTARLAAQAAAHRRISPRLVIAAGGVLAAAATTTTALAPTQWARDAIIRPRAMPLRGTMIRFLADQGRA
jgi:hypothetical protein